MIPIICIYIPFFQVFHMGAGAQALVPSSTALPGCKQEGRSKVEQLGLELSTSMGYWIRGQRLYCLVYANSLALWHSNKYHISTFRMIFPLFVIKFKDFLESWTEHLSFPKLWGRNPKPQRMGLEPSEREPWGFFVFLPCEATAKSYVLSTTRSRNPPSTQSTAVLTCISQHAKLGELDLCGYNPCNLFNFILATCMYQDTWEGSEFDFNHDPFNSFNRGGWDSCPGKGTAIDL